VVALEGAGDTRVASSVRAGAGVARLDPLPPERLRLGAAALLAAAAAAAGSPFLSGLAPDAGCRESLYTYVYITVSAFTSSAHVTGSRAKVTANSHQRFASRKSRYSLCRSWLVLNMAGWGLGLRQG